LTLTVPGVPQADVPLYVDFLSFNNNGDELWLNTPNL